MGQVFRAGLFVAIVVSIACDGASPEAGALESLSSGASGGGSEATAGEESSAAGESTAVDATGGSEADIDPDCGSLDACGVQCTDLLSDPDNCGACGVSCVVPNGQGGCMQGTCALADCDAGWGDCDGVSDNGCETPSDCVPGGACETTCGSTGQTSCADACAPVCLGVAESCNAMDDDCNGSCDEGPLASCRQSVHRSNSPTLGHFYTLDPVEAASGDLVVEALDYYFTYGGAIDGLVPFYRCLRPNGRRFYTQSASCEDAGTAEGSLGYVATDERCGATPLYRLYLAAQNRHFYTVSAAERDNAVANGWVFEFVAGYVWAAA